MSLSGSGLSAGGSNVDLDAIVKGGPAFAERLRQFGEAQAHAEHAKKLHIEAEQMRAEAAAKLEQAAQRLAEANDLIDSNKAEAARLAKYHADLTEWHEGLRAVLAETTNAYAQA